MRLRPPIKPVVARTVRELPAPGRYRWAYEPKFDGFRCLAFCTAAGVQLQSKQQRMLGRYFPEIASELQQLGEEVVLDGEVVICRNGRLDFAALQKRLHPAERRARQLARELPATYIAFDVLARGEENLCRSPYTKRREHLEQLLNAHGGAVVLTPATMEEAGARAWLTRHTAAGIEGIVIKRTDQPYKPGARSWQKLRTVLTAEAVVGGVIGPVDAPEALILGTIDQRSRLRVSGRTRPLTSHDQAAVAPLLNPGTPSHPWPDIIPSSRFGQLPSQPVQYTKVVPTVIVELEVDTAFELQRWRHPTTFRRLRPDLELVDLALSNNS